MSSGYKGRRHVGLGVDDKALGSIAPDSRNTKVGMLLTPEQIAQGGSEHAHQCAIFQEIALRGVKWDQRLEMLHAIPNGGNRDAHVGGAMKAEGVKRGVPDLGFPVVMEYGAGGRGYAGLYIEMKVPVKFSAANGGLTDDQIKWRNRLVEQGYAYATCYSWKAACVVLREYLLGRYVSVAPWQVSAEFAERHWNRWEGI